MLVRLPPGAEVVSRVVEAGTYRYRDLDIPTNLIRLTGQSDLDAYDSTTGAQMVQLERRGLVKNDIAVLDVGCGFGRIGIELRSRLGDRGSYVGVDIIGGSIAWAEAHVAPGDARYRFVHFDVRDKLHNPDGSTDATTVRLPADDASIDLAVLFSVFTHMLPRELEHYLGELRRVLRADGRALVTCFLYDRAALRSARSTDLSEWHLFFEHRAGIGCRINDPAMPTGAVAYSPSRLLRLVRRAGLEPVEQPTRGHWSGRWPHAPDFQDSLLLTLR